MQRSRSGTREGNSMLPSHDQHEQQQAIFVPGTTKPQSTRLASTAFLRLWFIEEGFVYDWLAALILVIINLVIPIKAIKPVDRFYLPTDPTLSYPASSGTISGTVLYILAFLFPGVVICGTALFKRSFHDGHHGLLSLLESFALATTWKRWMSLVGVYRPRWLEVLASGTSSDIEDSRQSYPSGHSTYMFCGCGVLTLYLLGKFRVIAQPGKGQFLLTLFSLLPLVLATFVSVTRVYDYKHAPADINAGTFIGLASAALAYALNFHGLGDVGASALPRVRRWTTQGMAAVAAAAAVTVAATEPLAESCELTD